MSNLKKYLKVYKEDAKHKKAFQQYMMVISENQDFFTRHEVNEFLTDMIKDGTLVYDEGFKRSFISLVGVGLMTFAFATASLKSKDIGNNNLDNKIENITKQVVKDHKENSKITDAQANEFDDYKSTYELASKSGDALLKDISTGDLSDVKLKTNFESFDKNYTNNKDFVKKYFSSSWITNKHCKEYHEVSQKAPYLNKMYVNNGDGILKKYEAQNQMIKNLYKEKLKSATDDKELSKEDFVNIRFK